MLVCTLSMAALTSQQQRFTHSKSALRLFACVLSRVSSSVCRKAGPCLHARTCIVIRYGIVIRYSM
jgi:hypothetical protein